MSYPELMKKRVKELRQKGYTASQVTRMVMNEFPNESAYPNEREVYRWCEPKTDTKHLAKITERHMECLIDVARILLDGDLDKVTEEGNTYEIFSKGYQFKKLNRDDLHACLENNLDIAIQEYGQWFVLDCFFTHLETDNRELKSDLFGFMINKPFDLIKLLRLAYHGNLKGRCEACTK